MSATKLVLFDVSNMFSKIISKDYHDTTFKIVTNNNVSSVVEQEISLNVISLQNYSQFKNKTYLEMGI